MTDNEIERIRELTAKLIEVTTAAAGTGETGGRQVLLALRETVVFWLAAGCPDCRREAVGELRRYLPAMLRRADRLADERKGPPTHIH